MDQDRFSGCLIGQCLGDALGFPVEGSPPAACVAYVRDVLAAPDRSALRRAGIEIGQYTDDSQLARELMLSYADRGCFDPEDYARRIAAMFVEDRIVGRGLATHRAAHRIAAGVHWTEAGEPPPVAGNGSAMRAAPVGLLFHDDRSRLVAAAHDQGRVTHRDPRCSAGAVAIASAVALAGAGGPVDPVRWAARLGEDARPFDAAFADELLKLAEWATLPPATVYPRVSALLGEPHSEYRWEGISPFVVPSVLWSLYAFLHTPDDYWETVRTAIAVGGDVDTTAAMAGAISGAYLGLRALPDELARDVHDQGTWGYGDLVALAHECHQVKHGRTPGAAR